MLADNSTRGHRAFCFSCHRTEAHCLCAQIPRIENKTPLLILQHRRERGHAFNTVRLLERALVNVDVRVGFKQQFVGWDLPLMSNPGLIYPSEDAPCLDELSVDELPNQLIMLDGTWHHAKTFVRDIPHLAELPTYRLAPREPGKFRIRREPTGASLSTLEAVALALNIIEPDTVGVAELYGVFERMIQQQLEHPNMKANWRRKKPRLNTRPKLPKEMARALDHLVVAYGEADPLNPDYAGRRPVCWMAERLGTRETFCQFANCELDQRSLANFGMDVSRFQHGVTDEELLRRWKRYMQPNDVVLTYNKGTVRLMVNSGMTDSAVVLKQVCANIHQRTYPSLDALLTAQRVERAVPILPGRAGRRLAETKTLALHLKQLYR